MRHCRCTGSQRIDEPWGSKETQTVHMENDEKHLDKGETKCIPVSLRASDLGK